MRMMKFSISAVALILLLCSCSVSSDAVNDFRGGVLLDDEMMSEIRSSVFSTDTTESGYNNSDKDGERNIIETESANEEYTEVIGENISEQVSYTPDTDLVFWVKDGSVWHLDRDCRYIKKSTVISGTVDEAIANGKDRVCSSCGR